nr:hypothetical protein [Tanacetum cinerariifolium]
MGNRDANPIRTLGDYSKPSHEGYRNTIELSIGNNVDCKTPQRYPDVSTTSRRISLRSIDSFQGLASKVPHYGIDLWLQVQIFYNHVTPATRRTIDQSAGEGLVSNFMASQDARLSKYEADFKQQQNPKCSSHPSTSINDVKTCYKEESHSQASQPQAGMRIGTQQTKEPKPTLEHEFQGLHLNVLVLKVLAHAPIYNAMLDKYVESLELGKNRSTFVQGEVPVKMEDPGLFTLPYRLGNSKTFDNLADLGSCSYPAGIVKDVEVHIGKLKLLNDFYVIDMKKDPETPLLVVRGFLATANAVIDCRKAKIAVGERITRQNEILTISDVLSRYALLILILTTLSLRDSSTHQFSMQRKILIWTSYVYVLIFSGNVEGA